MTLEHGDLRAWELVTQVPYVSQSAAFICLAINIFLPGVGTMICACMGDKNINKTQLAMGLIQLMTAVYLIGWFLGIYWGYLIVAKSQRESEQQRAAEGFSNNGPYKGQTGAQNRGSMQRNNPYEDGI